METLTTRVFNNGNSQAIRIPAQFRLETDEVQISRNEQGELIIHSASEKRGDSLLAALRQLSEVDEAFVEALESDRSTDLPMQEREAL
jgi:antitoxin VapB